MSAPHTLLRISSKFGLQRERVLPGLPQHYRIEEMPKGYFTVHDTLGQRVHSGRGAVTLLRTPVPGETAASNDVAEQQA